MIQRDIPSLQVSAGRILGNGKGGENRKRRSQGLVRGNGVSGSIHPQPCDVGNTRLLTENRGIPARRVGAVSPRVLFFLITKMGRPTNMPHRSDNPSDEGMPQA